MRRREELGIVTSVPRLPWSWQCLHHSAHLRGTVRDAPQEEKLPGGDPCQCVPQDRTHERLVEQLADLPVPQKMKIEASIQTGPQERSQARNVDQIADNEKISEAFQPSHQDSNHERIVEQLPCHRSWKKSHRWSSSFLASRVSASWNSCFRCRVPTHLGAVCQCQGGWQLTAWVHPKHPAKSSGALRGRVLQRDPCRGGVEVLGGSL